MKEEYRLEKILVKLILILGVTLSIIQFFYNRSLWLDESMISLNIINRSYAELLKPLDYEQVAPILFLQIEKIFSTLIPNSEYGLRLFPLISYWITLLLFYKIIKIVSTNNYTIIILALSLFVFNNTVIFYSSEVKQYIIDLLITTSIFYLLLREYRNEKQKYLYLSIMGILSIFLSNVAPIILLTAGIYLLYEYYYKNRTHFKLFFGVTILWASTFLLYYSIFIHNHPTRDFQVNYWIKAKCFLPLNPFHIDFYKFLWDQCILMLNRYLFDIGSTGFVIFPMLTLLGIINLIRISKINILIFTSLPICIHLILSGLKLYPFDLRLIVYNAPLLIIIYSFGIGFIIFLFSLFNKLSISKPIAIGISLLLIVNLWVTGYPIEREEIKKSIRFIEENSNNTDKIYLHSKTRHAYNYYSQIKFINKKFDSIIIGGEHLEENEKYIEEIIKLKGPSWILFSHDSKREIPYILQQIDSLGHHYAKKFECKGSSVYFYNF